MKHLVKISAISALLLFSTDMFAAEDDPEVNNQSIKVCEIHLLRYGVSEENIENCNAGDILYIRERYDDDGGDLIFALRACEAGTIQNFDNPLKILFCTYRGKLLDFSKLPPVSPTY